ncbi:hypothetical protein ACLBWX_14480 [Methylobacterium sp. M6A4_1b]
MVESVVEEVRRYRRGSDFQEGPAMTPEGVWWTRQIFGVKFYILFLLVTGLLVLGYFGRGLAI